MANDNNEKNMFLKIIQNFTSEDFIFFCDLQNVTVHTVNTNSSNYKSL